MGNNVSKARAKKKLVKHNTHKNDISIITQTWSLKTNTIMTFEELYAQAWTASKF